LNTIPNEGHWELESLWNWMDTNPEIFVGIFTGSGRAFCTGADMREWIKTPIEQQGMLPQPVFAGSLNAMAINPFWLL
jgi:enoyl-CoA hydratase/carnithine racemase